MKQNRIIPKATGILTGKYGVLLLTALYFSLALLVVTICGKWAYLNTSEIQTDFMALYLIDYRVGFVSRALIGSIFALFTDHPTVRMVTVTLTVMLLLSMLLLSFLQAKLVKKTLQSSERSVLLLSCLHFLSIAFWSGPFENTGLLDIFAIFVLLLYALSIDAPGDLRYWLAPIVCVVGLLIHTFFFFACFAVMASILWFDLLRQPNRLRITLFAVTCVVSVGLFVLFVFFAQDMVRMDWDSLSAMMHQKYDGPSMDEYFHAYLYGQNGEHVMQDGTDLIDHLHDNSSFFNATRTRYAKYLLPAVAPFVWGCVNGARKKGGRLLAYLGLLVPYLALFPELYVSSDDSRFFSPLLISQFLMLYYLFMQTNGFFLPTDLPAPGKKLSKALQAKRRKQIRCIWACVLAASVAYLVWGYVKL